MTEIHKYFGDSTPDGIQFQFRAIKADANALRQGKEPAQAGSATPKTPRTVGGRKRTAPSTGRSTGTKKSKQESSKKFVEDLSADLDDDSDNEMLPLDLTPTKSRVNEQKLREYSQAQGWLPADPPALESTQAAETPEDDDLKIVTPADAGPSFSFAQNSQWPTLSGNGIMTGWGHDVFQASASGDGDKGFEFEEDDLAGEC